MWEIPHWFGKKNDRNKFLSSLGVEWKVNSRIHPLWFQNVHKALQYIPLPFTSSLFPLKWNQAQSILCVLVVLSDLSDPLECWWRQFKLIISIRTIWKPVNNVRQLQTLFGTLHAVSLLLRSRTNWMDYRRYAAWI